jgi:hypothetical protein
MVEQDHRSIESTQDSIRFNEKDVHGELPYRTQDS